LLFSLKPPAPWSPAAPPAEAQAADENWGVVTGHQNLQSTQKRCFPFRRLWLTPAGTPPARRVSAGPPAPIGPRPVPPIVFNSFFTSFSLKLVCKHAPPLPVFGQSVPWQRSHAAGAMRMPWSPSVQISAVRNGLWGERPPHPIGCRVCGLVRTIYALIRSQ